MNTVTVSESVFSLNFFSVPPNIKFWPDQATRSEYPVLTSASSTYRSPIQYQDIVLLGIIASDWEIVRPISVMLEYDEEDSGYIMSDDKFMIYGVGDTRSEAYQDYVQSLIEYYQLLATRVKDDSATETLFRNLHL